MFEEVPPLKVWFFTIGVFATAALSFLCYAYSPYGPYGQLLQRSKKNLEQALIENTRDTSATSIVIVGSSLTEFAFVDPKEIEDSITLVTSKKTKVLRLAVSYMDMDIAQRIDFFNYVSKYPPDYLFIENFSFNTDDNDSATILPIPVDATLLQLRNYARNALGMSTHDNYYVKWYTFDIKPTPGTDFYTNEFDSIIFRGLQKKVNVVRKANQNTVANNAYKSLIQKNSKVIFLDMPQSTQLPYNFLDNESRTELNEVLKFYQTEYRIAYWRFPYQMDDASFTDGSHLNSKGAMQFQKWFISEFSKK